MAFNYSLIKTKALNEKQYTYTGTNDFIMKPVRTYEIIKNYV